ncbi:TPA: hypothetical protein ACGOWA_000609 [Streptococcus suis]
MVELGIASYLFGKTADFSIGSLLDTYNFNDKKDKKALEKFIEDFKKELLSRHKENPDFEQIEKFWKDQDVVGELFEIYYLGTSSYENYPQFKTNLKKLDYKMNSDLCFSLMDQFANQLKDTIVELSGNTKSMVSAQKIFLESMDVKLDMLLTKQGEEELRSSKQNNLSNGQVVAKENESMVEEVIESESDLSPYDTDIKNHIILSITGGFENNMRSPFKVENFDDNRVDISTLILNKNVDKLKLENKYEYIKVYEQIKEMFEAKNSEDANYEIFERVFVDAKKEVLNFERKLDKVYRCIQLYFNSPVSRTNVIATPTDLKNFIEIMLNRSGIATSGKKYQFFVDRNDGMYFNVYLSNEEIDYVNKQDSTDLLYARMGGALVKIENFSKKAQLKIISELLLNLVDKQNVSKRHYVIDNYFITVG